MKLSIIIPAYNTEEYINQCIDSVLEIKEIENEIIVVNDGSTDNTEKILNEYTKKYSNIKVITQKNQGAAIARNTGIKASSGDYIYFLDSDDWIETTSFEKIIKDLENDYKNNIKIDVVIGKENAYNETTKEKNIDERLPKDMIGSVITGKEFMKRAITERFWNVRLPIYLYRRELLTSNNILFPDGRRTNEDEVFSIDVFYHTEKIKITNDIFGYYRARAGSIMAILNINHAKDIFSNVNQLIEKYKNEKDKDMKNIIFYMIKRYYKSSMKKAIQCNRKDVFDEIYKKFKVDFKKELLKTKFKKYENIELYIIYYTRNLIFDIENKIKKQRNRKKRG